MFSIHNDEERRLGRGRLWAIVSRIRGGHREKGGCFLDAAGGGKIAHRSEFSDRGSSAEDARRVVSDSGVREGAA